jgi:hypothetical protein
MVRFHQEKIHTYGTIFFAVFVTIFFMQLLVLFSPVIALMLTLPLFVVMFCAIEVGDLLDINASFRPGELPGTGFFVQIKNILLPQLKKSLAFSSVALVFALLREFLAFRSFSLPSPNGMIVFALPRSAPPTFSIFWASIPGCLVLFALFIALKSFILKLPEGEDA